MADPVIMAANERIKSISRTMMQLGAALLAGAIVRMYADAAVSLEPLMWLLGAGALIFAAWKMLMLMLLESET